MFNVHYFMLHLRSRLKTSVYWFSNNNNVKVWVLKEEKVWKKVRLGASRP